MKLRKLKLNEIVRPDDLITSAASGNEVWLIKDYPEGLKYQIIGEPKDAAWTIYRVEKMERIEGKPSELKKLADKLITEKIKNERLTRLLNHLPSGNESHFKDS